MEKTYMHTGIPVAEKMDGMAYMAGLKVWICNNEEYKIEYLYWEKDTPCAWRMVAETHVAYKVGRGRAAAEVFARRYVRDRLRGLQERPAGGVFPGLTTSGGVQTSPSPYNKEILPCR